MADIRPFRGHRFDAKQVSLTRALCPPYDVIGPQEARRLRRDRMNAIHLELPAGTGEARYSGAAKLWRSWTRSGALRQDESASLYVCEERFRFLGRSHRRLGFLGALGVDPAAARFVVPHERTLPKPKADRLRMLESVGANISPIFGVFPDPAGAVRRVLARAAKGRPVARGRTAGGVSYRLWSVSGAKDVAAVARALKPAKVLIADGHHRYEVSRAHHAAARRPATGTVLSYFCPEEDAGLLVLPTHRVVVDGSAVLARAEESCRLSVYRTLAELLKRLEASSNVYAFGLYYGAFILAEPRDRAGCRSGLGVEWLAKLLLSGVAPDQIRYTPYPDKAMAMAKEGDQAAVLVKPFPVKSIRRAVKAVGLLPPKSTYFYPKVATGLVFKQL